MAAGAVGRFGGFGGRNAAGAETEKETDAAESFVGSGTQPAVMADPDETFGQNVQEPATDQFMRSKGLAFEGVVGAVAVAQNDAS